MIMRDLFIDLEIDLSNLPKDKRGGKLKELIKELSDGLDTNQIERLDLKIKA